MPPRKLRPWVSRVRVGDSRVRGRGRGQGVSAFNGRSSTAFAALAPFPHKHWGNKHALPPFLLLREKKTTLPPFCFEEQKTQTIAAISAVGEQRLIKHRRHFCWRTKIYKTSPPFLLENKDL